MYRLPPLKFDNKKRHLPSALDPRQFGPASRLNYIFRPRRNGSLPRSATNQELTTENSLLNTLWYLSLQKDALWAFQRPCHL